MSTARKGKNMSYAQRRQAQARQTERNILQAALTLMRERGFDKVSIRDICKQAGITTGAFYHHFPSKESLLNKGFAPLDAVSYTHLHRLAAVAGDEVGIFGEEGGEEDELVAGAGQGPEAAAQSCRRPHRQVQVAGPVAPAEAAGQGVRQGLPDGPIALGGGIAVDGGPLGRVQDGPDGVVHLGRRGHRCV